jgi:hypothetical protein
MVKLISGQAAYEGDASGHGPRIIAVVIFAPAVLRETTTRDRWEGVLRGKSR